MAKTSYLTLDPAELPIALTQNPFFDLYLKIAKVYADAMRQNIEHLVISSTNIVQDQAIQAWTKAAKSCTEALVQNAVSSQEQAIGRISEANHKVFEIMSDAMTAAR